MRSRRPVTVAAWAFVAAFAFSSAPSTLAQAPRTAIDAAVQDERNRYKARKHEFELRKIDARAEWQIAHLRAGTRSPSHRTGAASSGTSPAAVEPSLEEEAQRHRARLGELDQRMRDAHAQWQTDHRNCRANDACDKRASQNYDDRRLEIAKQKVKEQAAHEKKLAALRAASPTRSAMCSRARPETIPAPRATRAVGAASDRTSRRFRRLQTARGRRTAERATARPPTTAPATRARGRSEPFLSSGDYLRRDRAIGTTRLRDGSPAAV